MAEPAPLRVGDDVGDELLRARLRRLERRLGDAARESRAAGFARLALVIAESAEQLRGIIVAALPPPAQALQGAIARAERALDAWRGLRSF